MIRQMWAVEWAVFLLFFLTGWKWLHWWTWIGCTAERPIPET